MQSPPDITERAGTRRKSGTKAENFLWYVLRNRDLCAVKFVRQQPIGPYFADFVGRDRKLIVELDGGQHAEATRDTERTAYLNLRGFSVLRFWNNDVLANRDGVLESIRSVLHGAPSPDLRFAPATLAPAGRGTRSYDQ